MTAPLTRFGLLMSGETDRSVGIATEAQLAICVAAKSESNPKGIFEERGKQLYVGPT